MFLPWSLFTINVLLVLFQVLLVGAVGVLLSIYSRFGGEYGNSIRWSRQGGYREIYTMLFNSREIAPTRAKFATIVAIFLSLAASLADKGAIRFVNFSETNQHKLLGACTPMYLGSVFSTRYTSIQYGDNIVDAMTLMLNNTQMIPAMLSGQSYTPRISPFYVECGYFDVYIGEFADSGGPIVIGQGGCEEVALFFTYSLGFFEEWVTVRAGASKNRWSIRSSEKIGNVDFTFQDISATGGAKLYDIQHTSL